MNKILIGGAGGVPSENVIRSLNEGGEKYKIIGMGSEPSDLILSSAETKYVVPYANRANYWKVLSGILNKERPNLLHCQNDFEILEVSKIRDSIQSTGTKLFMPKHETVVNCVDKGLSAGIWERSGITIPKTMNINSPEDLKVAFDKLSKNDGKIWIRATQGGGGKGALPTGDFEFAKKWIDQYKGWGGFTAAELLTADTVTWLSIWYEGELVVAQGRKRKSWNLGNRTLSGVTGVTGVGETCSDALVDKTSIEAILSIDSKPHGIFAVDMTYDVDGIPNPTEINISRFFTTVYFFTKAGLNMPAIFVDIALHGKFPVLEKKINPLPEGLLWIRAMDREPLLTTEKEMLEQLIIYKDGN